jgi:hypothetical protein
MGRIAEGGGDSVEFKVDLYVCVNYIYSRFHQHPSDNQS